MIVAESQNQASETNEPCGQIYQTISPDDETHGSLSAPPPLLPAVRVSACSFMMFTFAPFLPAASETDRMSMML